MSVDVITVRTYGGGARRIPCRWRRSMRGHRIAAPRTFGSGQLTTVLTITAVLAAAPAPAAAHPQVAEDIGPAVVGAMDIPGGFASWAELFTMQDKLNVAADALRALRGTEGTGYAGVTADPADRAVHLYWKGSVPAAVHSLARDQQVPVQIRPARHTEAELSALAWNAVTEGRFTSAAPRADGSGLVGDSRQVVAAGVSPADDESSNRIATMPPFGGGFQFRNVDAQLSCTLGFTVNYGSNKHIVSSGQCGDDGDQTTVSYMSHGDIFGTNKAKDLLLVESWQPQNIMYWPRGTAGRRVRDAHGSHVGNYVCTMREYDEFCDMQVQATGEYVDIGYLIGPLVRAEKSDGGCVFTTDRIGGPVYTVREDGYSVNARGTLSAGILNTVCPIYQGTVAGSSVIWYVDIMDSLAGYGATIATS
ncbi:hypothetical protein O7621_17060 [Solwaraspora sp. WMMD937]|uniref:hypothetical protein n=1 Tax=Solwaraspora sp. WMMD937 TaxID=3016090 RepID=UPI00249B5F39|nr:hypothetical protein [Solwaraspora sp. WMMD937]WFE19635.1 hypothetical protein O7621_17060 [Solwaraspora sp. WMMD937]